MEQMAIIPDRNHHGVLTHTFAITGFLFNHVQCKDANPQNTELWVWKKHLILQDFPKRGAQPSAKDIKMNRGW